MNYLSFFRNVKIILIQLICIFTASILISGCYSFTGATIPPHLKTLAIPTANDNSGFGNARLHDDLTGFLQKKFRSDNSFVLVQDRSDARLSATIISIGDATVTVRAGELETERKVTVTIKAVFEDLVKKKTMWDKPFSQFQVYKISDGTAARDKAISDSFDRISDDILLATVSGW